MPWVYKLTLTEYKDAGTVESDWQSIAGGGVANSHGGVCVSQRGTGAVATVVSTPRKPNYGDMANYSYVNTVTESHEIPKRSDSSFDPPIDIGHGIQLVE